MFPEVPALAGAVRLRIVLAFASLLIVSLILLAPSSAQASAPVVTLTATPGPATNDTTPTVSFTATGSPAPTFACKVDSGAFTACSSPFTTAALSNTTSHSISVRATNVDGTNTKTTFTFVDTRTYGVTTTLTKQSNSLTAAADVSKPAKHPNVNVTASLAGAADTKKLTIVLPKGLNGALAAIPVANRCSLANAAAGTCPAASRIGSGTGTVYVKDSGSTVAVTGDGYLTVAPTANDAAGLALKATVAGGRGNIIATGGVQLINNGSNVQMIADNLPTTTTTGVQFHVNTLNVTLEGNIGGASNPLITNPSYCGAPAGTLGWAPYNSSTNPFGYKGQFVNVLSTLDSYSATQATASTAYTISGCSTTVAAYNPALTVTLDTPSATTSKASAAMTVGANESSTQRITSKLPPKLSANFSAFGAPADMCPTSAATNTTTGATGVGNAPFSKTSCPTQSRIGQVRITTPLLTSPLIGNVYLVNKSPLPWLGVHIDPTINVNNAQGVTADMLLTTGLPYVNATCDSSISGPCGGPGTGICDIASGTCQQQVLINGLALPDLPISAMTLYLGKNADGSVLAGRIGTGGITTNDVVAIAKTPDNTCSGGSDPNAVTPGPFTQSVSTSFVGWSQTTSTGTALAGGTKTVNQSLTTPGC